MKKNWVYIILSLAVLFSLGFLPTPGSEMVDSPLLKPTSSALAELTVTNQSKTRANVAIWGAQYYFVSMPPGPGVTRSIKVKPGTYKISVAFASGECKGIGKNIKINKKTRFSFACGKIK